MRGDEMDVKRGFFWRSRRRQFRIKRRRRRKWALGKATLHYREETMGPDCVGLTCGGGNVSFPSLPLTSSLSALPKFPVPLPFLLGCFVARPRTDPPNGPMLPSFNRPPIVFQTKWGQFCRQPSSDGREEGGRAPFSWSAVNDQSTVIFFPVQKSLSRMELEQRQHCQLNTKTHLPHLN